MRKILFIIAIALFAFFLFFYRGITVVDSDLGWHVRMGQIILHSGIPKTDPLSYTMPSYPFVDHEWLSNVLIAIAYPYIGIYGLAILFAFITLFSVLIAVCFLKKTEAKVFFLLSASILAPFTGIRTQEITWLFFSLLIFVLYNEKLWQRFRFSLPILFLAWVNFHGGFAIGIVVLSIFLVARIYEKKEIQVKDFCVLLLCIGVTLLNPYGYRIWWEVWMQITDQSLRWTIAEWMPIIFQPLSISLLLFFSLSLALIAINWKKFTIGQLILYSGLLAAGLSSARHIPLWVIAAIPLLTQSYDFIKIQANKYKDGKKRFTLLVRYFSVFILIIIGIQSVFFYLSVKEFSQDNVYPRNAVAYLQRQKIYGNVFSVYNWGGYLDLQLPEKKVFIDGRMPSWRWKSPYTNESDYAFQEYRDVGEGKIPLNKIIRKYHITVFLLPTEGELQTKRKNKKHIISLPTEVESNGFRKEYEDTVSSIYRKEMK